MIAQPRVSVLTPIYNTNLEHLRECIDSILAQTFTDFEFIILNDSPDNAALDEFVKSYKDPRIAYHKNDRNIGISASRNKLLDLAACEYVAIFDHDDISMPDRLKREVEFLDANPTVGVVSSAMEFFGGADDGIHRKPEHDIDIRIYSTDNCSVFHTACMIRKSVLDANNVRYQEQYTPCEDYQLWARLMEFTDFHNLPDVLVRYRYFTENTSHNMRARQTRMHKRISLEICCKYPAFHQEFKRMTFNRLRIKLFGLITLFDIRKSKRSHSMYCMLFGFIPIFKWRLI